MHNAMRYASAMSAQSDRLRAARTAAGYSSAQDAAERLNVPYPTYSAHENGSRGYRADSAERYAKAFGCSAEFLLFGIGEGRGAALPFRQPAAAPAGFAETELTPWEGPRLNDAPDPVAALAPRAQHPSAYLLSRAAPGFSLLAGDVVILDLNASAKSGDLVVAQVIDTDIGAADTVLRRYLPPYLVTATAEPGEITDRDDVVIKGPVVASFRLTLETDKKEAAE